MVTHPCINWAHDCLTSVIKRKTFAPCYVSPHIVLLIINNVVNSWKVREHRHRTTLERPLRKYEWLCQQNKGGCSNISGHSNKQTTASYMYGTECCSNIRCSTFFTTNNISTNSTNSNNNSSNHNNYNNSTVQVGEESIKSSPHRSPSVPAGPWTQFHYNPQKPPPMGSTSQQWNKHV